MKIDVEERPTRWRRLVMFSLSNLGGIIATVVVFALIYAFCRWLNCIYEDWGTECPPDVPPISEGWLKHVLYHFVADAAKNMDFLGYFLAVITFIASTRTSFSLDIEAKKNAARQEELLKALDEKTEKNAQSAESMLVKIKDATGQLEDATRKVITSFKELLTCIEKMLEEVKENKGELKIMNWTSSFGRIHTYNWKVSQRFVSNAPQLEFNERLFKEGADKLLDKIDKIETLMTECADLKKVKYLFLDGDHSNKKDEESALESNFIQHYLQENDSDIVYYTKDKGDVRPSLEIRGESMRKLITAEVKKRHNEALKRFWKARDEEGHEKWNEEIRITEKKDDIPMQICLTKYDEDPSYKHSYVYRTLAIFAVDVGNEEDNERPKSRTLIGIYSTNPRMYEVFSSFFHEPFKKSW